MLNSFGSELLITVALKNIIVKLSQIEPWEYFSDVLSIFFNTEEILKRKYAKKPENVYEQLRYDLYQDLLQQLRELQLTAQHKTDIIKILHDESIHQAAQSAPLEPNPTFTPVQTQWTPCRPISLLSIGEMIHYLNCLEPDKCLRDVLAIFFDTATFLDEEYKNPSNSLNEQRYHNLLKQLRKRPLTNDEKATQVLNFHDDLVDQAAKTPRLDTSRKIADLETANRSLERQVQQTQTQTANAITQWQKEVGELSTQQANEKEQFKRKLEQSRLEAQAKLLSVTEASKAEIQRLNRKIDEFSHQVHLLETQNSERQTQYEAMQKEKQRLAQQWEEIKTIQIQEKAEFTSEKNNAWAEAQSLKQQISDLEEKYLASERQKQELLNKLNEIKTTTAKDQAALISEKETVLAESQLLKQQLSQVEAQYHTSEREKLVLKHELQKIKTATVKDHVALNQQQTLATDISQLVMQISTSISHQPIGTAYALSVDQLTTLLFAAIGIDKNNYAAWNHLAELYSKHNDKKGLEAVIKDFEQTFSQGLDNTQHECLQKLKNLLATQALVEWTATSAFIEDDRKRIPDEHPGERPTDPRKRQKSSLPSSRLANAPHPSLSLFPKPNPPGSSVTQAISRSSATPQIGQVNSPSSVRFTPSSQSS